MSLYLLNIVIVIVAVYCLLNIVNHSFYCPNDLAQLKKEVRFLDIFEIKLIVYIFSKNRLVRTTIPIFALAQL